MSQKPDTELYELIRRHQAGDGHSGWLFAQHKKIKAIIKGRIRQYRQMYHWLPAEDYEDVEFGLIPRIIELLGAFKLSEQPNDGRVISYFALRLRGEADFLLKKITGMKQVQDEDDKSKTYLRSYSLPLDGLEDTISCGLMLDSQVVNDIEFVRQDELLEKILQALPDWSNDRVWLRCYILRLKGKTWAQIAKDIGYKQTDYTWLKDNTGRFVTRLKHKLILMGEETSYRICGIYTDSSMVSISVFDPSDSKNNSIWSKDYSDYQDLDRVEAKLGDVFRQFHISYVVMNEEVNLSSANVIVMRYLSKRESFVETVDLSLFTKLLPRMVDSVGGVACSEEHRKALLLAHIKKAHLDECSERVVQ